MLSFLLIGGLVWLAVALVFVLALAAAARPQSSPSLVAEPQAMEASSVGAASDQDSASDDGLLSSGIAHSAG
jgi:hypothetical protein